MTDKSDQELRNHTVHIELENGGNFTFLASWNHGLGDFIRAYEEFIRGQPQPKERYHFRTADDDQTNDFVGKFEQIVAIHLNSKRDE